MRRTSYRLADRFLIVPNLEHFFGEFRNDENCLDIMATFTFRDIAQIHLIRLGAIAIRFLDEGPLRSIMRLQPTGDGEVPEDVMGNHDEIVELQSRRTIFANFIAAALFGRLCALTGRGMKAALQALPAPDQAKPAEPTRSTDQADELRRRQVQARSQATARRDAQAAARHLNAFAAQIERADPTKKRLAEEIRTLARGGTPDQTRAAQIQKAIEEARKRHREPRGRGRGRGADIDR